MNVMKLATIIFQTIGIYTTSHMAPGQDVIQLKSPLQLLTMSLFWIVMFELGTYGIQKSNAVHFVGKITACYGHTFANNLCKYIKSNYHELKYQKSNSCTLFLFKRLYILQVIQVHELR